MHSDAGLSLYHWEIPIDGALKARFIQHDGMQRLRKATSIFESLLRDVTNFVQFFPNGGSIRHLLFSAAEQRAYSRQGLAEFVMKFPGNMAQGGFLSGDQLPREFTPLTGERRQPLEQTAIRMNQIEAGGQDRGERCSKKKVDLALDSIVSLQHLRRRFSLAFVIFDKEASERLPRAVLRGEVHHRDRREFVQTPLTRPRAGAVHQHRAYRASRDRANSGRSEYATIAASPSGY